MIRTARTRRVSTARMSREELARTWAAQHGVTARTGGWLYDPKGRPVCQGWASLADSLERRGVIRPGVGVCWMTAHRTGAARLTSAARQDAADGRARARR